MYQLVTDRFPYPSGMSFKEISRLVWKIDGNALAQGIEELSPKGQDFLAGLLQVKKQNRLTSREALDHKWFEIILKGDNNRPPDEEIMHNLRKFKVCVG